MRKGLGFNVDLSSLSLSVHQVADRLERWAIKKMFASLNPWSYKVKNQPVCPWSRHLTLIAPGSPLIMADPGRDPTLHGCLRGSWECANNTFPVRVGNRTNIQWKMEVYIHLSQILLISVFHNSWHLILLKIQLASPLYFKNVKCQNISRENDLFQVLFLWPHSQWVGSLHSIYLSLVALPLNCLTWVKCFG